MDYKDFEKTANATILDRGKKYFDAEAVSDLEKMNGQWVANVDGTEQYAVVIKGIRKIKDWECDCPYDGGPVCKHVLAVLYAIRAEKSKPSKSKKSPKSEMDQIFAKVPEKELIAFFRKKLRSYKDLKQDLFSEFMEYVEVTEGVDKYSGMINKMIKSSGNKRYGFVDYKESIRLAQQLSGVMLKAQQFSRQKNYVDTLTICKSMMIEVSNLLDQADDSGGYLQDILYSAYSTVEELFEAPIAPIFKDKIFGVLYEILQKDKDNTADIRFRILDILLDKKWGNSQYQQLVDYLKNTLDNLTGRYTEYSQEAYLSYLSGIYANLEADDALQDLEDKYIHLVKIRKNVIERLIEEEAYEQAQKLILEGIEIAKEKNHSGTVSNWKDMLIRISSLEGDITTQRALLKEQYLDNGFRDGNKRLSDFKQTYSSEEWITVRTSLINLFNNTNKSKKGQNTSYKYQTLLANLYIAEEMWEDLLGYIETKELYSYNKIQLAYHLEDHYPEKIITIYADYVREMGVNSRSRPEYKKITAFLKGMLKVKGSELVVKELVQELQVKYDRRPAMLDELRKVKL